MSSARRHPFAPGAIEHHTAPNRRELTRWLKRAALVITVPAVLALVAGYLTGA